MRLRKAKAKPPVAMHIPGPVLSAAETLNVGDGLIVVMRPGGRDDRPTTWSFYDPKSLHMFLELEADGHATAFPRIAPLTEAS